VRRFMPFLAARLMRLLLLVLAGVPAVLATSPTPAAASPIQSVASTALATASSCTSAAAATYRHTFDGPGGTVTITAVRPLCAGQTQTFSLVSYTTGAFNSATGQFLYDSATATISATRRSVTLRVAVPACFTQVDAFFGSTVRTETTSTAAPYGTTTLGSGTGTGSRSAGTHAWYAGGTTACTAIPTITYANACNGTFTAKLTNAARANAKAVFLTGSRRIRLSPGTTTTIKAARNATLTIRTSTFTTYVGTWRPPAAACTTTAAKRASTRTGTNPGVVPARAVVAPATASPSPTHAAGTGTGGTAEPPAPAFSVNPAAIATDEPTALAATGSGLGSAIALAIGFVMIGGGVAVLTRLRRTLRRAL
jgi:hypothetical protein